jgi:rhodanese-related sulfurtransferase
MKTRLTWLLILMLALTVFWGCSDDDDDPITPTATAFETMAAAGAAYINTTDCPGTISSADLQAAMDAGPVTVIDIRNEEYFLAGHIAGAYRSSLGTLIADLSSGAIPAGNPYVIACYSGQSAGHAKIAMELLGYSDVKTLLFGMSSWDPLWTSGDLTMDKWTSKCGDALLDAELTNNNADLTEHTFPTLTESVDGVVAARVADMLTTGFKGISYEDLLVLQDTEEVFIMNYWGQDDYDGTTGMPGHIPGAFQFTPYGSLGIDQMLVNLPTDKKIVVYCWTGQHSSQITAYLNMLGYEALSLTNGANHLFYNSLTGHKWDAANYESRDLEVGYAASATFTAIAEELLEYVNSADCPGVMTATDLNELVTNATPDDVCIIDIRAQADFDLGHIDGAYQVDLADLLTAIGTDIPLDEGPFVVVCKSGQTAGHAKLALEMAGYVGVKSLKFGMSSWNADFDVWTGSIGDALVDDGLVETTNNNGDLTWHAYPNLDGETMATRVDAMLAGGFKKITYTALKDLEQVEDVFVLNYFGESDYMGETNGVPGHYPGAYQFTPRSSLGIMEMLGNIPTDQKVVVYCWTGQTSSQIAAYLNMLGYDAYSLLYGSNGMFHSTLEYGFWTASGDFDYWAPDALAANF